MGLSEPQPLTFYLNAYEIRSQVPSNPLKAFRIPLNMDKETVKHLKFVLTKNNIVFHRQPSDYYEYKAGYYIYDVEKWSEIIKSDKILSNLEHYKEYVEPISYVVRSAILRLIENKLKMIEDIQKVRGKNIDERKFYFTKDLLEDKSSLFGFHRCFVYRVEYIHRPPKKLLLLILPSILVRGKESLENLIKRGVPLKLLIGLPFKVMQEDDQNTRIKKYVGFLEDVKGDLAVVRPADLTVSELVSVPLRNLYAIGRIDLYRKVVEFLGEDYGLLYDYKGRLTFAWEKGVKMKDAPLRMKREIENLHRKIFAERVFPLKLQEATYTLSDDPVSLEIIEEE